MRVALFTSAAVTVALIANYLLLAPSIARSSRLAAEGHARGLASMAGALMTTALELEAQGAGESALDALFEDSAVVGVRVEAEDGSPWLERLSPNWRAQGLVSARSELRGLDGARVGAMQVWLRDEVVEVAFAEVRERAVLTTAGLLLVTLVLVLFGARRQLRPLGGLSEAARRIARGDVRPPEPARTRRRDEIGLMAGAFHEMQEKLLELSEGAGRVASGDLSVPRLGEGKLFVSFETMVEALASARRRDECLRDELSRAAKEAEVANEAKGRFLARVSHELRTPLNGVIGMAEIVLDQMDPQDRFHGDLKVLRDSGSQMLRLVNEVLEFARLERGEVLPKLERFSPAELVATELERFREAAEAKGLSLTARLPPVGLTGRSDPELFRQVASCLLDNAVKFTATGGVTVSVDVAADRLVFFVADTGIGISEEAQSALFGAFEQGDGSTTRSHRGVGLGLALSQRLVHALGGEISVSSVEGEGSRFQASISFSEPVEAAPEGETAPVAPREGPIRVLLVEDERVNQMVASRHLKALGVELSVASNGEEAVDAYQSMKPDIILMDCMMPVMDGYAATRAIRALEPSGSRVPIVAVTANALPGDREKCLEAGMDDHVAKPVRKDALSSTFARWVR